MERLTATLQLRHTTNLISKLSNTFAASSSSSQCASQARCHAHKSEEVAIKRWSAGDSREEDGGHGGWPWPAEKCVRRQLLAGLAWPFLITTVGRQAANAADATEDPVEMAVVAALDARDMLPALSTFLLQSKSKLGPSAECKIRLKSLNNIHERLKVNLPLLVEELEINEDFADQLLQGLAFVEEDLCSHTMVSSSLSENSSISRVMVEGSLKLLKLARSKVDLLLQKVPRQLLELAQLARGVRPMA